MPTYLITGANRGLGLEFVHQLSLNPSNKILACVRNPSTAISLPSSPNIHVLHLDTSSHASISVLPAQISKLLSADTNTKIDFLLNNAGINLASAQTSLTLQPADLLSQISTNVLGPAQTVSVLLAADLLAQDVVVMNMTSGLGSLAYVSTMTPRECCGYSVSKAALNMLTVHQAEDLRGVLSGARVVCVDPGWVKTSMGGEMAPLSPEESIRGVLKVVHGLEQEDGGKFFRYDGEVVAW